MELSHLARSRFSLTARSSAVSRSVRMPIRSTPHDLNRRSEGFADIGSVLRDLSHEDARPLRKWRMPGPPWLKPVLMIRRTLLALSLPALPFGDVPVPDLSRNHPHQEAFQ